MTTGRAAYGLEAALVEPAPLAPEQLVLDRVGDEGMGEPERVVGDLDHDTGGRQRAQRGEHGVVVDAGDVDEGVERRRPAVHRERLDDRALGGLQAGELLLHRLLQRPRQLDRQEVAGARLRAAAADQLLDDERDAAAAPVHGLDDRRRRLVAADRGDERGDLGAIEAVEADLLDGVPPLEPQHQLATGLAPGELGRTVRADHDELGPALLGDAVDRVGAGRVDPVEVLDHEHRRAALERRRDGLERARLRVPGIARDPSPAAISPATASPGRPIEPGLGGGDQRRRRRPAGSRQLADEPGLADPGLAGDEGDRRLVARHHLGRLEMPARWAKGPARPTITGLIPARPVSMTPTLPAAASSGNPRVAARRLVPRPGRWHGDETTAFVGRRSGRRAVRAAAPPEPAAAGSVDAGAPGAACRTSSSWRRRTMS